MKIELKTILLCALMFAGSFVSSSADAIEVSAFGGLNISVPTITSLGSSGSTVGFSGGTGAILGYELAQYFTLELGALYLQRVYGLSGAPANINETRLIIPLLLRLNLPIIQPFIGPYYSQGIGNMTAAGVSVSYAAQSLSPSDYGILLGVGNVYELIPNVGILTRAQFMFGLPNVSTSPLVTANYRDIQFLAGFNFKL